MKNPLEYTLLEVSALLRTTEQKPNQSLVDCWSDLLRFVEHEQELQRNYQVQREVRLREVEAPAAAPVISRSKLKRLEREAEVTCVLVAE